MADDFIFDISTFVQGNNGNILPITVRNKGAVIDVTGAMVRVAIKKGEYVDTKQAVITDAANGKCEVTLMREDLATAGLYFYQPTITYADDREFSGDVEKFRVAGKLTGAPPVTAPSMIEIARLGINANGKLTIDGVEQISGGSGGGTSDTSRITKGIEILSADPIGLELWEGRMWIVSDSAPANTVPTAPVISLVSTDNTTATIKLDTASTDTQDGTISTYEVYKNGVVHATITLTQAGTYQLTGLSSGTTYNITLKSKDSGGLRSAASNSISAVTTAPVGNTAPSAPVISLVDTTQTAVTIKLDTASTDSEDGTISTYEVYKNGVLHASNVSLTANGNYQLTGLTASTVYAITLKGKDSQGALSAASNSVNATTAAAINSAPTAPVISLVSTTSNSATIKVDTGSTDAEQGAITTYEVYRDGILATTVTITSGANYTLTGLNQSTTYAITLKAKDSQSSLSVASNSVSAVTIAGNSFAFVENFDGSYDTNKIGLSTAGTSTVAVNNGSLEFRVGPTVGDAGIAYFKRNVVVGEEITYKTRFKINTTLIQGGGQVKLLTVAQKATAPTVDINTNINGEKRIDIWVENYGSGNQFKSPGITAFNITNGAYYELRFISKVTGFTISLFNDVGTQLTTSNEQSWPSNMTGANPFWMYSGEPFTNYYNDVSFDIDSIEVI